MVPALATLALLGQLAAPAVATSSDAPWRPSCDGVIRTLDWTDSRGALHPQWRVRKLDGSTRYHAVPSAHGSYLLARAENAASGLYCETEDLDPRGVSLCWGWRADRFPAEENLRERGGDDRAAAVTVVFRESLLPWRARAIFYVWSAHLPPGTVLANPYASGVKMIVLRRGEPGEWHHEHRDLARDYRRVFGEEPERIRALGVLTDADNTGGAAAASYGPLRLVVAPGGPPQGAVD
jgi:hypothetical protein